MIDTKNQPAGFSNLQQTLHAQLFAITSQSRVLSASSLPEEQAVVDSLVQNVRDLVEGVEDVATELGTMTTAQKARRNRAEKRLAEEICQRALAFSARQCNVTSANADDELHAITIAQKAHVQLAEQALARNICKLSQGLPLDPAVGDDAEALKTMLISYHPNQGILNIAIDTGAKGVDCTCQPAAEARQRLTFAMQIQTICRMALDLLHSVDC